jgi:V8-like Glu-specific endopeptidase
MDIACFKHWELILAATACLLLGAACHRDAPEPEVATTLHPIVGGEPDPGHPAVGYLELSNSACTGTLVTPLLVLTAAHCVSGGSKPISFTMYGPDEEWIVKIKAKKALVHPQYGNWESGDEYSANDIALVVLKEPALVTPMSIRTRPLDCLAGTPITFVGYGMTDAVDYYSGGWKLFVESHITQINDNTYEVGTTPGNPGCPCFGDSGGPALVTIGSRTEIVGIVSTGDWWCAYSDTNTRVDTKAEWLLEMISQQDSEGIPAPCGDGWCDLTEGTLDCPDDCVGGAALSSDNCTVDTDCSAPLRCRMLAGQNICGELCPDPAGGTGCPCGLTCRPIDVPTAEFEGLCVETGFVDSACGNGVCEPGESDDLCPPDCTAIPCHMITSTGCCAAELATWCDNGVLHQHHCAGDAACGWDETLSRYGCGTDGAPNPLDLNTMTCPALGPECGNGLCEPGETQESCFPDCPVAGYCGDNVCQGYEYYENCPEDCFRDECEFFPASGCCLDDTVVWCTTDGMLMLSCGPLGGCGWNEYDMMYDCGPYIVPVEPTGLLPMKCEEYSEPSSCGDGLCDGIEEYENCPEDCLSEGCQFNAPDGCCDGHTVKYCFEGQQYQVSCAPYLYCGWSYADNYYMCGTYGSEDPTGNNPIDCSAYAPMNCGDGFCQPDESSVTCPGDCSVWGDCEDGICGPGEAYDNCPQDCRLYGCEQIPDQACCAGEVVKYCQNNQTLMINCSTDPGCGWLSGSGYYWCGTSGGDDPSGLLPRDCSSYANPFCGDGLCLGDETSEWCPEDCLSPSFCGDGICDVSEQSGSCPLDCPLPRGEDVVTDQSGEKPADTGHESTGHSGLGGTPRKPGCSATPTSSSPCSLTSLILQLLLLVTFLLLFRTQRVLGRDVR